MRRILGVLMLLIGAIGIMLSIAGIIAGQQLVDEMAAGLEANLKLTIDSLDTIHESLLLTKVIVGEMNEGLTTVETTADNVAITLNNTRPLLQQISDVTSQEVPESLETLQESIPALLEVASAVDSTLGTLSAFRIDESILGIPFRYDLGINYEPEVPFAESVADLGSSLDGLPAQLRTLDVYINVTDRNVQTIGRNVTEIADSLSAINESVAELNPLLDDYVATVTEVSDSLRQSRLRLARQVQLVKIVLTVVMAWLGLAQIAPLYLGWELAMGRR